MNAESIFEFDSASSEFAECEITTSTTVINGAFLFRAAEEFAGGASVELAPFSGTRGFNVPAGPTTFNLLCRRVTGNLEVVNTHMTAIFTAQ